MDVIKTDTAPAANQGAVLELRGPDGALLLKPDKTPVTITLLGKDSDVYIAQQRKSTNRLYQSRGAAKLTAEGIEADAISLLAKCTVAWDGIGIGEDSTPCAYESAIQLYAVRYIRDQVDAFIDDRSNFSKASPTT